MKLILAWVKDPMSVRARYIITQPGETALPLGGIELLGNPEAEESEVRNRFLLECKFLEWLGWIVVEPTRNNAGGGQTVIFSPPPQ